MTRPVYVRQLAIGKGMPKICVPLTGRNREEILRQAAEAAVCGAEIAEWRADYWEEPRRREKLEELLFALSVKLSGLPLLFTVRTEAEGGRRAFSASEYMEWNQIAADSGKADLIDVEYLQEPELYGGLIRRLKARGAVVIASSHDFAKTDPSPLLLEKLRCLDASGADILKLAVMPEDAADTRRLMAVVKEFVSGETSRPVIAMAMGKAGEASRVEGQLFGSALTFGTAGEASAPGQLPVGELRRRLEEVRRKLC